MAEHFYSVYDWMTDDLRLCGIELTVFALIHSFTETGREYDGSLAYIAQRTGTTRRNAIRMLQKLVDKKLLCKTEHFDNGVKYCVYRVPDGLAHPLLTDRHTPKDESSPPPVTDRHTPKDESSPPPGDGSSYPRGQFVTQSQRGSQRGSQRISQRGEG